MSVLRSDDDVSSLPAREPDDSSAFGVARFDVVCGLDAVGDGDVDAESLLTVSRVDPGFSLSSSLREPAAGAAVEPESCWSSADVDPEEPEGGVCDESDELDGPDVEPEDDELDDLADFVPAADVVDDPVDGADVPAVADFADGPAAAGPEFGDDACEVVDGPASATAIPGLLAIAAPSPSATASAPILLTNRP